MKSPRLSTKRIAIDKANGTLLMVVGVSVFVSIFSIVASNSLIKQLNYQARVIDAKETTLIQVEKNINEVELLTTAYKEFAGSTTNIIEGNPKGTGDRDGENSRIILDALPSKYDAPALISSLDKLLKSNGFQTPSIMITDDEIAQSANTGSENPVAIDMPFSLEANIAPTDGKRFLELFEKSIRPIQIQKVTISSQDNALKLNIAAKTYFQPEKKLNVTEEVVK